MNLVPLPVRIPAGLCARDDAEHGLYGGFGVAVCEDLLVISSCKKLQVFALPDDIARCDLGTPRELVHLHTLGGAAPMEFQFHCSTTSYMAFTDGVGTANRRLLLVTDTTNSDRDAVHVIDVVRGTHVGYVAAPSTIACPRGVATRKSLAAVACCDHVVRVYEGSDECTWAAVRVIAGGFVWPTGLRFTANGSGLAVADFGNERLSIFCAKDGSLLRHIDLAADMFFPVNPLDVEECNGGDSAGWIMCHFSGLVMVTDDANGTATVVTRWRTRDCIPCALASVPVPGFGLVVRHRDGVEFLATPEAVAMASMSLCKVAWMTAVCRG